MNEKIERRAFQLAEVRAEDAGKIVGHAAVFDRVADIGWFKEKISPGAFKESIPVDDVRALWNHDPNFVLGRNKSETLRLSEDDAGLAIEIDPPDTQWARDLVTSMKRGDVSQMSFGFEVQDAAWETVDGEDVRVLKRVKLWDVSVVTYPAYVDTDASVRSTLAAAGLNFDALAGMLARSQRGASLKDADRELVRASIDALASLEGKREQQVPLDVLRRKLDLALIG